MFISNGLSWYDGTCILTHIVSATEELIVQTDPKWFVVLFAHFLEAVIQTSTASSLALVKNACAVTGTSRVH